MTTDPNSRIIRAIRPYLLQDGYTLMDIPVKDLHTLREHVQTDNRKRGEVLFRQGTFPKGAFWLLSGKVKIFQETPAGQRQTLYIYSNGDLIGYRQVIAEEVNPVSAIVLENATIGFIPAGVLRGMLEVSPIFARNVLVALSREFSVWLNRMTVFAQLPVRQRLALALLILYEQFRRSGSPAGLITMTRTELAEYVGASLETVVRALNTLKSEQLVRIDGRRILLPTPAALVDMLGDVPA